jgi:O-antigen/teichoic acid export membrane protein
MIKKIIGTVWTRIMIAGLTLLVVILNAHYLGAANTGTISLIILSVTIVQTVNNFIGGGAIVYLVPRTELVRLVLPAYTWALVTSIAVTGILAVMHLIPAGFVVHVLVLSFIYSLASVNFMVLLGKEKIREYNVITLLQIILLLLVLLFFLFVSGRRDAMIYVYGLYASYTLICLASFSYVIPGIRMGRASGFMPVIREIFRFGGVMQIANILQLLNYRLGVYLLETFLGRAAVGIYSVGAQVSEGIWIIPRSISMVLFSRISNTDDKEYAQRLTLNFIKVAFLLTFFVVILLLLIPASFFTMIFGKEFGRITLVIASLSVGIVMLSVSIILSSYYGGTGKPVHNMWGSAIGLVFTIVLGLLLIPRMGVIGAGIAASASYSAATVYQVIVFIRTSGFRGRDFILTMSDIRRLKTELLNLRKKTDKQENPENIGLL